MFNGIEYIREVCNSRKIPITQLERECGFSNGYLNPKKLQKLPYDRAKKISEYLGVSLEYILNGPETEKAPAPVLTAKDERDIAKKLQSTLDDLENGADGLMFDGEPLDDETRALLRDSLQNQLQMTKLLAKQKFTPKKYRQ